MTKLYKESLHFLFLLALLYLLTPLALGQSVEIVGGTPPEINHPGKYNTVALIKSHDKKIFCSGSIISSRMILTAKHCLIEKEIKDFFIFFGDDTNKLDEGVIIRPKRFKLRHPKDWQMTFPSFDIAWIELEEDIPSDFKALPILHKKEIILKEQAIHLVGHGNSSPIDGHIQAGEKLMATTSLKNYYNNSRFFHILLFEGEEGKGACHGDSGGPSYAKVINPQTGKKEWTIIGVTNGFDIVLTPKAMPRTNDPDFPYGIDCRKNQILYSFAGAHGNWIESTSGENILKTGDFKKLDRENSQEHSSIDQWCKRKDIGSPQWNFLKLLLDQKVDTMPQHMAEKFYNSCEDIKIYLQELRNIKINGNITIDADYSFLPLSLLSTRSLKIFDLNHKFLFFRGSYSQQIQLESLQIKRANLSNLNLFFNSNISIANLDVSYNNITSLKGISYIQNLENLNAGYNKIKSAKGIETLRDLKGLNLAKNPITDFSFLENLEFLESLNLSRTNFKNTKRLSDLPKLRELVLEDQSFPHLDLSSNKRLQKLKLTNVSVKNLGLKGLYSLIDLTLYSMNIRNIDFLEQVPNVKRLVLQKNNISNLHPFFKVSFKGLEELNLSNNPIDDVSPLRGLINLKRLRLFGTPLAKRTVPKNPVNCPVLGSPRPLAQFCSR